MRVLITTDAFPPNCGGSGWSAYELVKGLRARGHHVFVVQPVFSHVSSHDSRHYDGVEVLEFGSRVPDVPVVRAYLKNERLGASLSRYLGDLIQQQQVELVHAQHVLTAAPSVAAARASSVPVLCTVRDYWPVCYWGDLRFDNDGAELCPACSVAMMTKCVRPRAGSLWPVALGVIPYMRHSLTKKRQTLSRADAVIAVSGAIAQDLRARAPELNATRVETIPNMVDVASMERAVAKTRRPIKGPYAVYVGKLAANKGSALLPTVLERAELPWPLAVIGDGPGREALEIAIRGLGRAVQFTGWLPREETLQWLGHAELLIFPSQWPEPLSRVLLEASALGVAVAAMETGGTGDILAHEQSALLSATVEQLADHVKRLAEDRALRERLGESAREVVRQRFAPPAVLDRMEELYRSLIRS